MGSFVNLLPFVLIAAVFWFLLIRPQRRRQQEMAQTQRGIEVGDEVMLGSGIYGYVADTEDDVLHLEISPGVKMRVARQAVVRHVVRDVPDGPDAADGASEPSAEEPPADEPGPEREI